MGTFAIVVFIFAILMVFTGHTVLSYGSPASLSPLQFGGTGVDLFFVLSGFIMAYVYVEERIQWNNFLIFYRKFILSRIARIYPLHLITLLLTLIFVIGLPGFYERFSHLFTQESFISNLFLDF